MNRFWEHLMKLRLSRPIPRFILTFGLYCRILHWYSNWPHSSSPPPPSIKIISQFPYPPFNQRCNVNIQPIPVPNTIPWSHIEQWIWCKPRNLTKVSRQLHTLVPTPPGDEDIIHWIRGWLSMDTPEAETENSLPLLGIDPWSCSQPSVSLHTKLS